MTDTLTYSEPVPQLTTPEPGHHAIHLPDSSYVESVQGDSLFYALPDTLAQALPQVSSWRDASAGEVFGTASTLAQAQPTHNAPAQPLTDNPVFQAFVLSLAATYAILLYRNLGDICALLSRVSRDTATGERLSEDTGGSGFSRFLNIATTIGLFFAGILAVRYGASLIPDRLTEMLPHGAVLIFSVLATLACAGVILFQMGAMRLTGAVTLSQPFISQMVMLKRTYFTLAVIVAVPFLLLLAFCPPGGGKLWFCILIIELVVAAILYFRESLNLFISKKISVLHWILYLCVVEIFPVSLLWLLAVR
ncbi:DUF4271 domain-containing protein [uncultured Alistipes sp.]|jgi:hypothetical protein|uniref:DUF4271 domain-containing protein n=1 Tax=uncultured Alistipes sp. TaxID=538949 RepID=UPI0025D028B4|nr:DUF4271 domain-containing protein [uncultured Alistipes sp.]